MNDTDTKSKALVACTFCKVRKEGICATLTERQLETLSKVAQRKLLKSNDNFSMMGENSTHYANIISGVMKLSKTMKDGRHQTVGLQFSNDFVGEPFHEQNEVDISSAGEVHMCSFPKEVLDTMIVNSPELGKKLHEQAWKDLEEARNWLLALGRKSALEKVASFLSLVAERSQVNVDDEDRRNQTVLELPLSKSELADFLGLTLETVSRKFTDLRKKGILEPIDRRTIMVHNIERLADISDPD